MALTILFIGLLVFLGHFLTGVFERTKIPDVLVLMIAGIAVERFTGVTPEDFGKVGPVFSTLALIIILFEGGIHLSIKELGAAARDTIVISLATFIITVGLISTLVKTILGLDWLTAILIGSILGGTSSAVVVPMIRVLRLATRTNTILLLESALTDVLAVVLSLGLLRGMTSDTATIAAGALTLEILKSFSLAALIGFAGAFVWSAILPMVRQFPNTVFTTIAYVLILFGLTETLELSGAIAALTFGIAVTNLPLIPDRLLGRVFSFRLVGFADVERTFFAEAVFLIKTFFFVFLGISLSFGNPQTVILGLTATALAFLGRAFMVRAFAPRSLSRRDAMLTTLLIPKGLAAAVLASLPIQMGIAGGQVIQETVYAVIFFSITLCALFVFIVEAGMLNALSGSLFGPFAETPPPDEVTPDPRRFNQSIGLPALVTDVQEPNPIRLDPNTLEHPAPPDHESPQTNDAPDEP